MHSRPLVSRAGSRCALAAWFFPFLLKTATLVSRPEFHQGGRFSSPETDPDFAALPYFIRALLRWSLLQQAESQGQLHLELRARATVAKNIKKRWALRHFPKYCKLSRGVGMWIFLAKIHAEIATPVYAIWENAIAKGGRVLCIPDTSLRG